MEGLLPFLLFIGMAVIAVARKIHEQRDIQRRQGETPEFRPEDLPEPVRRMLFGDDEPGAPVARPRHPESRSAPPPIQPTAQPRRPTPVATDPRRARPRPIQRREASPARPPEVPRQIPGEVRRAVAQESPRQIPREVQQHPQQVRQERVEMAPMQPRPSQDRSRRQSKAQPTQRTPQRKPDLRDHPVHKEGVFRQVEPRPRGLALLFANAGDVRKAVLYSEILGPPKSMRGLEADPWETTGR
ncbi:MAG: hypothetical protein AMXMBFR84_10030 [Candidatus Hydrogenedentota bacterium]